MQQWLVGSACRLCARNYANRPRYSMLLFLQLFLYKSPIEVMLGNGSMPIAFPRMLFCPQWQPQQDTADRQSNQALWRKDGTKPRSVPVAATEPSWHLSGEAGFRRQAVPWNRLAARGWVEAWRDWGTRVSINSPSFSYVRHYPGSP